MPKLSVKNGKIGYYDERLKELEEEFDQAIHKNWGRLLQLMTEWNTDAQRLQAKYEEIKKRREALTPPPSPPSPAN